ncbi:retention module-containing protein [Methylophaga sp. OBS1]|uniref:retention module-containing protein n=1 Tax=Methylophaga sp. OBS1 TaxID=2991933 RepID=UPI00224DABC4|nr:retention module-containing protein [Methylophaga sp. OBS1]MCX4193818.1 retention module-containing protein [Methylophaga sp. OBS1]
MATQIGVIKAIVGTVTATAADGSIRTLQAGDRVYANEVISTGPSGAVEIEFADGSVMDLGRDSQAMLDTAVFDPEATDVAEAEGQEVPDDVAAIQQAILEGEDPTEAGEATAAGAGVAGGNEGHDAVFVDYLNPEVTPDAGFETIGVNNTIDEVEDEQLIDGVPTAGITTVLLDEDDLITGGDIDLSGVSAEFIAYLNSEHGVYNFGFDSPAGVGDERTELGDDTGSPDGHFLGGSLIANFGTDGPSETNPIVFNVTSGADVTDSEGNPVTSEGQQVKYWVSADGLTVIGYIVDGQSEGGQEPPTQLAQQQQAFDGCEGTGDDMPEMAEIIFTAQLTPNVDGGSFLVGIFGQFDHEAPDYANGEFVFENNMFLNLGFTITDADGDSATGTLQINVDDDSPVRTGDEEEGLATQTGTVLEDGLSFEDGDLSDGNPNSVVTMTITSDDSDADQSDIESFLGLSAGALEPAVDSNGGDGTAYNGSASKTTFNAEAGDIISFNWSFDDNDGGTYNDFAFVVINGEVFELADSNGGNLASNPFTYEVTADGVVTIGFGQMNVGDQIADSSLSVSDLTLNGNPVVVGFDTLGTVTSNADVASGDLNSIINMGADGPGSFGLLQSSENEAEQALFQAGIDSLPTLSSKGEAVSYAVTNNGYQSVLVASAGDGEDAREVFTLTINADGSWTFDLNDQLDHVAGETAEENFSLITLDPETGEPNGSVDSIDFTQLLQIRDFDGDQLVITEDDAGMFTISIQDDIPVATEETVNMTVDEDDIVTDSSTGNDPFDNGSDGSYTGEPVTIFGYTTDFFNIFNGGGPATTSGSVSSLVSFGADEEGTFSLGDNFAGLEAQELTSKGDELSFEVQGDTLIASADGRAVFTLELNENGEFTFKLYDQIDHMSGEGENNLTIDLSSIILATDNDNDTITLDSGFTIDVTDDVPEQDGIFPDVGIVEEEALPAGNQEGYDVWPDTAVATGSLADQVSVGADEGLTFGFATDLSGLPELTSDGEPVSYEVNGDTLTASTESGEVFTLTLESNGDYTFMLKGALDHSPLQGENLEVINFSSIVEATDFDGDTITLDNDFFIKIVDDMPVATGESVTVTVDEDDIVTDSSTGNDPFDNGDDGSYTGEPVTIFGYTTDFFNIFNGGGPATTSGSVASLVSFGADENGTFSLSSDFAGLEAQGLTSKGDELSFEVQGDILIASADGRAVFTLELDDNGDFTFSLYDQLDHAAGNGENNLPLDLSSVIQATDSDEDTITLDSGFTIDVTDDVPEQTGLPDIGVVEEEALPAGNQEGYDVWPDTAVATGSLADQVSVGADEGATFSLSGDYTSLIAQNLTSDGEPLTYSLNGNTLTATAGQTPVFTLSLESNGDYTFTLVGPLDHADSVIEENLLYIDLSGIVNAEDFDGDTITLNQDFYIKVIDDSPEVGTNDTVLLDDDALQGGNPGGPADDADASNVTGTLSHSFGADGGSISWQTSGAPSGFTYETSGDDLLIKQGGETVLTLSLNPETGEYSVTQNAPIDHQDDGNNDENNQVFNVGYLVTDNDDDTETGSLQINVDDDTPTVEPYEVNTMRIISDDDTVAGLNGNPGEGTNTNDGAGTDSKEYNQSKTLQFSTGADGGTVAWNVDNSSVDDATAGISFSVNGDGSLIITQMQNGVPVQVAEITLDANTGEYNYTQTSNLLHTAGDNENEAAFTLGFTVTDGDGDTADGHLTLLIDDDTPVITSQQINLLTESFEDFAPDLSGNNWTVVGEGSGTIIGNNGIEWTVNAAGIEIQSGNAGGASASDGDVHAELDAHDSNGDGGSTLTQLSTEVELPTSEATLSFDFQPRPSDVDGSDMSVSLGDQTVNINVDGAGVIDFGSLPAGVTASQTSSAGGWTTITLTFTGLDTSSAQTLSFEGQGAANTLGAYIDNISLDAVASLTVDESALTDGNGEAGASTTASFDFSGFFTGAFGADGPADADSESYSLNLSGEDIASGLYAVDNTDTDAGDGDGFGQGAEILLNQVGDDIVGSVGGVDYFTISVDAETGEVTLTQHENIWHADTTNPDDSQGMVLDSELLTLVKTITDADEDSAEATLDLGGVSFNFEDDAPTIEAQQPAQPYLLTVTNEGGDAGYNNTYGFYIKGENGEPVSGEIIWANVKDNESDEITVEVTDPSDIGFFIIPDGADLNDLNNGDAVTFEQDGEGNWQVLLDGEPLTGQGTSVLFDNADLNPGNAEAVEDNVATGNQNWEDIIGGDNDFNDVNINVSINQLGAITVDETDIGNGDPSNATATLDLSGSFTADFGADGPGDVDYALSVDTDVETGLVDTLSGKDVELRVNGDGVVEGYITTDDNMDLVVFTASVDDEGVVTLTQLRAVEHDDATDPDEANSPATLNAGAIALTGTVTDADGDSADGSIDVGVLFAFEDDGPVAADDVDSIDNGTAEGNVVTADSTDGEAGVDSYGADGAGSVTSVSFGDTTVEVPADGSVEIEGDYGTLTMHSDGSYTYTADPDSLPQNTQTVEGWTNTGSNMTAFNLGESFLTADGKFSDTGSGTVSTGGNAPGFGVAGTSGANTSVPEQINQSGSESEALAFKFAGDVTAATVQFSNLFNNENGGEAMRWHAFDADGNRIGSGIVSDNDATDPYAGNTDATYSNNNVGSFTISDIGAFSTLVFEGVPYSDDGSAASDDSDFFVNVTSYEVFNSQDNAYQDEFGYTIVDGDGDSASATLTLNGNSEPQEGQLEPVAPVAADNTYQVDGVTSGNIITDDDDNGGAASGRDYDNDTPVINLSINSIIVNGDETIITEDGTEIELDNGTLVINLDGSYTYTPAQDADGGDEFEYTLVDPDGEVSEPATVTLLEPLVSDVVTLGDVSVNEGDGTAIITGSVENPVTGSPLVISLSNGATITIPVGHTSADSTPFSIQGDDVYLDGESYSVEITGTSGGQYSSLDTSDEATVTVSDTSDTVTATLTTSTTEVSEDGGDITYTITLSGGPGDIDPDADLVFTLANGEQVTISAGDTSGSFTRTYTDAEITNQSAITNSISGIASGGSEYEDLQTAGETSVDVNYDPEITDLTPAANGGDVTVDEDDLPTGSDTTKESTTQEGTFTISSGDAIDDLTIDGHAVITDGTFSTTSFTTALGNTLSVTGYDANTGEITYTYELADNTLNHGPANNGENGVFENLAVSLSDVDGDVANDTLSVQIIDDVPTAVADNAQAEEGSSETLGSDLVLMIDTSASVSSSQLASMKASLQNLFNSGSVHSVFITSFAEGGEFHDSGANGGWYTDLGDAMAAINGLSSSGTGTYGTDYDAALEAVTDNFTAPPAGGDQLVSMFISDGEPNETNGTGSYGIIGGEESAWIDFLEANNFDNSYAVGYNGLDSTGAGFLEPIAWTEGEGSSTHSGSDDDNVIILDNVEDLADTLTSTVTATPNPVTGNVLANDDAGADGFGTPALVDVTYDGNTVTFSGTTTSATFNTVAGEVVINSDGSYEFTGLSDTNTDVSAVINYTIQDADGDQSNSNLVVTTQDSVPTAVNDVDDVDEATWSINGTDFATVTTENWSDTPDQDSYNINQNINPGWWSDASTTNNIDIDADNDHQASILIDIDISGYRSGDQILAQLYKVVDGGSDQLVENVGINYDQTVSFNGIDESGQYYVRLYGSDNTWDGNLRASMSNLRVNAFDFTQNTYSTTVNTAALAALAAATGNVLANDDAGADGGLSVTEVNGDAVSGSTNIDGLYGTLTIDENGDYTYTPNVEDLPAGMSDSFTYTVTDADGSEDTATLTIDINDHNYVVDDNDNVAVADAAGGTVNALDGDDVLIGSDQADTLMGGAGNDNLMGNDGDDTLIGGAGNDILTGGDGADIFKWESGDDGTSSEPAVDFVTDFNAGEGDVLDLADLLVGESDNANDLTNYLSFESDGTDTVINVSPTSGGDSTQQIVLQGVDLTQGGTISDLQIIQNLLGGDNLDVDPS